MKSHGIFYPSKQKVVVAVLATILSAVAAPLLVWQYTTGKNWAGVLVDVIILPSLVLALFTHRFSIIFYGGWVNVPLFTIGQLGYCYVLTCLARRLFKSPSS
jgi:hypothetical protein